MVGCNNNQQGFEKGKTLFFRVMLSTLIFFNMITHASKVEDNSLHLQTLAFVALEDEKKLLNHFYSLLDENSKSNLNINEKNPSILDFLRIYRFLVSMNILQNTEELVLSDLGITRLPFWIFSHMENLKKLNLSGNPQINLKSPIFKKLCHQLEELNVSNCRIDKDVFSIICSNCCCLSNLNISNNPDINFSDQNLETLKNTIKVFAIEKCELDTEGMKEIATFKHIEVLNISGNFLKDFFETNDLDNLKNTLTELKASKIGIVFKDLEKIRECSKIIILDISCNNLQVKKKNETLQFLEQRFSQKPEISDPFENSLLGCLAQNLKNLNVSRVNLSLNHLKEILDCPSIEVLDCSSNDFLKLQAGFTFGAAKNSLVKTNFSDCFLFQQAFLLEILDCPNLKELDISSNNFKLEYRNIYFGSSSKSLVWLDISDSAVNAKLFIKLLENFEVLEYLDISKNFFRSGTVLFDCPQNRFYTPKDRSFFGNLALSLKTFKISECEICDDPDFYQSLLEFENLEYLDISNNSFSRFPEDFAFVRSLETLKVLIIYNCGLRSVFLQNALVNLKALETLDASNNTFSRRFQNFDFGSIRLSLVNIKMSACRINSRALLEALTDCAILRELNLSDNYFLNLPNSFRFKRSKESLEVLNMSSCFLEGGCILYQIVDLICLKELYLSDNIFRDASYENLSFGSSLRVLEMDGCHMASKDLFEAITSCRVLERLSIAKNMFSWVGFEFGRSKYTLKSLNIRGFTFGNIGDFYLIFDCPKLEILDISRIDLEPFQYNLESVRFGSSKESLRELKAVECNLENPFCLWTFTNFPKLEAIDISSNPFLDFLENFTLGKSKKTLRKIMAEHCRFKDKNIIKELTDCERLEELILHNNWGLENVSDIAFGVSKKSLKGLGLAKCGISLLNWINEIGNCNKMQILNVSGCNLVGLDKQFDSEVFRRSMINLVICDCEIRHSKILLPLAEYYLLESVVVDEKLKTRLFKKLKNNSLKHKIFRRKILTFTE